MQPIFNRSSAMWFSTANQRKRPAATLPLLLLASGLALASFQRAWAAPKSKPTPPAPTAEAWPQAPTSEPWLLTRPEPEWDTPILRLEAPQPVPPPNDLLTEIAGAMSPVRGTFFYPPFVFAQPASTQYVVFRSIGFNRMLGEQETNVASYHVQTAMHLFDPEFSADGRRILLKGGWPWEETSTYNLYLWDMVTGTLRMLTDPIHSSEVYWSPDNNYIAYLRGGNAAGREAQRLGRVRLRVVDVRSGKSRHLVKNPGVRDMAWTHQGTLLFVMAPKAKNVDDDDKNVPPYEAGIAEPEAPPVPSVFEVGAKGGAPKMLIEDATKPMPSPNGKWIAFVRPSAAQKQSLPTNLNTPLDVYLFDRSKQQSVLAGAFKADYLRWTPDSSSLVIMDTLYYGERGTGGARGEAAINVVNPLTLSSRQVAVVSGRDYQPLAIRAPAAQQFRPLKFSRDGRFLFAQVEEILGPSPVSNAFNIVRATLQAINLNDGRVFVVARTQDDAGRVVGFAWHDETGTSSSVSTNSVSSSPRRPRENIGGSSGKRDSGR